ncbi:hypothetical protein C7974DRAFT_407139 [Boeremia exigua]|uniref:uncharacterized protein n=1 Tax=Boeremia exigua TaxID=749465 RepID=UPI001E8E1498|nr:uncharacterized protein C7974DRAFT_407139 [Boeremia exigua]KAH6612154.1 hypothetical protein C7974DRAFT_407139 [Boeremia exigua]
MYPHVPSCTILHMLYCPALGSDVPVLCCLSYTTLCYYATQTVRTTPSRAAMYRTLRPHAMLSPPPHLPSLPSRLFLPSPLLLPSLLLLHTPSRSRSRSLRAGSSSVGSRRPPLTSSCCLLHSAMSSSLPAFVCCLHRALCCAALSCVELDYRVLYYGLPCSTLLCHALLCQTMSNYVKLCQTRLCHATLPRDATSRSFSFRLRLRLCFRLRLRLRLLGDLVVASAATS